MIYKNNNLYRTACGVYTYILILLLLVIVYGRRTRSDDDDALNIRYLSTYIIYVYYMRARASKIKIEWPSNTSLHSDLNAIRRAPTILLLQ